MRGVVFTHASGSEYLWLLYYDLPRDAPVISTIELPLTLSFVCSAACFVPLGQIVGAALEVFGSAGRALEGYAWDISGSIAGIAAFALMNAVGAPPVVWFSVIAVLGSTLAFIEAHAHIPASVAGVLMVAAIFVSEKAEIYSPYYALATIERVGGQFALLTNGSIHQEAIRFPEPGRSHPTRGDLIHGYQYPYSVFRGELNRVLILGAGTGNDVVVALRNGARQIDVVEIDPQIVAFGVARHPNDPFSSDRVSIYIDDARSFLQTTTNRYDLIVFGTLDSTTKLSALSNVRLDNFVYTKEAMTLARSRLNEHGGMALFFSAGKEYLSWKLVGIVDAAFDVASKIRIGNFDMFNLIILAGPAFQHDAAEVPGSPAPSVRKEMRRLHDTPTDDWPFLYLESRGISAFYVRMIGFVLTIAVLMVLLTWSRGKDVSATGTTSGHLRFDGPMFFLGAGFLLLETRAITAMNLLWGATWITSAVVFSGVLITVLMGTLMVNRRDVAPWISVAGIVASLAVLYALPVHVAIGLDFTAKLAFSLCYAGTPIFFASLYFARVFKRRRGTKPAFGWNILGAVCGGMTEFLGMLVGFRALILLAFAAYVATVLADLRETGSAGTSLGASD